MSHHNKILREIIHDLLDKCDKADLDYLQGVIDVKLLLSNKEDKKNDS